MGHNNQLTNQHKANLQAWRHTNPEPVRTPRHSPYAALQALSAGPRSCLWQPRHGGWTKTLANMGLAR